jgi:hypothetical protein
VLDCAGRDWIPTGNPWFGEDLPGIVRSMFPDMTRLWKENIEPSTKSLEKQTVFRRRPEQLPTSDNPWRYVKWPGSRSV